MISTFRAFVVNKTEQEFSAGLQELTPDLLPEGDVLVKVAYSSVNYKDALAALPDGKIVRSYPFVPGIDLAGTVVESQDARFREGDEVIVTSYDLGVSHYGGFSEYARVKAAWIVPLPAGLTLREAMTLGTAGFTAALAVHQLQHMGLKPGQGKVLVTGASGGVGSVAISILHTLGYQVTASTGKQAEHTYLQQLGAETVLGREETSAESKRPLEKELWAGAVDSVGGATLAYLLRTTAYGGAIATCGNTGGPNFSTTVFPFILRSVALLGIDSVNCPMELRRELWQRLASDYKPPYLNESIAHEIPFSDLPSALQAILQGNVKGRTVVKIA